MSSSGPILVTGATGNVGREVARALREREMPFRAAARSVESAREVEGARDAVALDFLDPTTFAPAVAGCSGLFLLRPPAIANTRKTLARLVDAAVAAGVERVVFLSVAGAERNRFIPHHAVEQHLVKSGIGWTFLRAGFFAQNLGDAYRHTIRDEDCVRVPAGDGRVAFVDAFDLGDAAATAFADGAGTNEAWWLTGPEAISFDDFARILSDELGRPIGYERASAWRFFRDIQRGGGSLGQAAIVTLLHLGLRRGDAEPIDPTLAGVLGRPPRTLRDYVRDNAHLWERRLA